jgi:hypothetical protein
MRVGDVAGDIWQTLHLAGAHVGVYRLQPMPPLKLQLPHCFIFFLHDSNFNWTWKPPPLADAAPQSDVDTATPAAATHPRGASIASTELTCGCSRC